jgi:urease subunit alpha
MPFEIDRGLYARMYGPTTGDRVRLGDTNLLVEVERDEASPGDETLWGFGKTNGSRRTCSADDASAARCLQRQRPV